MIRVIVLAFLVVAMFLPTAQAEDFECIVGISGTYNIFSQGSEELLPLFRWEESGVMMSKSENKFLDNASVHWEGVNRGFGKKRAGYAFGKIVDPDGDIIIMRSAYTGPGYEAEFLQGTGKYKGIAGSYKGQRMATVKPVMPGTYQNRKNIKGTFELPK